MPVLSDYQQHVLRKLLSLVDVQPNGCWNYTGRIVDGYGRITYHAGGCGAHRIAYMFMVGPIEKGLHIDHVCRNRRCCNPAHLEKVTPLVNRLRSLASNGGYMTETHCRRGHDVTGHGVYLRADGKRICRACTNESHRRARAAKRASSVAA